MVTGRLQRCSCRSTELSEHDLAEGTGDGEPGFVSMAKTLTKIEIKQQGDERFLLMTFADASEERKPIVKLPRNSLRLPYRKVTLDKSRKKGF